MYISLLLTLLCINTARLNARKLTNRMIHPSQYFSDNQKVILGGCISPDWPWFLRARAPNTCDIYVLARREKAFIMASWNSFWPAPTPMSAS